jgi:hypothetical protein
MRDLRCAHDGYDENADQRKYTQPHGPLLAFSELEDLLHRYALHLV